MSGLMLVKIFMPASGMIVDSSDPVDADVCEDALWGCDVYEDAGGLIGGVTPPAGLWGKGGALTGYCC